MRPCAATSLAALTRALAEGAAAAFTGDDMPAGCLLASSAAAKGGMPDDADPDVLAACGMATIQGLSTLARDGAPRAELQGVARFAPAASPSAA